MKEITLGKTGIKTPQNALEHCQFRELKWMRLLKFYIGHMRVE